ncbi:hypothetical protein DP73_04815 [Desulfosporosinus sp. HMP52]|uniref:hypothetical protein n=1 Tax=Desulfosporosinus sp. HMP52 TaxID=1487923 RepID=UPI00051F8F91|nr:hypothetical protein [Desulfosporosinus sp. HMP52]KGK91164.1 hypothetical protein DP73_04815 [Desulfosporosinus sp. HMP52]
MKKRFFIILVVFSLLLANVNTVFAGELFPSFTGKWQGKKNTLNFSYPFKADIYFGGNTGGQYGKYTHCALARDTTYAGDYFFRYDETGEAVAGYGWTGMTVEATPTSSTNDVVSRDVHRFWFYDWAAIGYVPDVSGNERDGIVDYAWEDFSGPYDVNSNFWVNNSWQCSKLVERAYYDMADINIGWSSGIAPILPVPDDIYYHTNVAIYTTSTAPTVSKGALPQHALDRLKAWKNKGVDTKDIKFELGIQKEGFSEYLARLEKRGISKEDIKSKYNIDDSQYNQIMEDAKETNDL